MRSCRPGIANYSPSLDIARSKEQNKDLPKRSFVAIFRQNTASNKQKSRPLTYFYEAGLRCLCV